MTRDRSTTRRRKGVRSIFFPGRLRAAPRARRKNGPDPVVPAGFTLFELILAIALAAVLLSLIGMAINLYLKRIDSGRSRVEQAQLARTILAMIAEDIRATAIYQPQDTSSIAKLMSKSSAFDPDSLDKSSSSSSSTSGFSTSTSGTSGGSSTSGSMSSGGSSSQSSSTSSGSSSSTSQSSTGGSNDNPEDSDTTMPLGVNGSANELCVDAARLPRQEELFSGLTGYTNASSPAANNSALPGTPEAAATSAPPTDLKTVHYLVRPGEAIEAGSASATALDPAAQSRVGGLVRQESPRAMYVFAQQNGGSDTSDAGQTLIAPEVVQVQFRYFDGSQISETWDMKQQKKLPVAIEVCIWLRSSGATDQPVSASYDAATLASTAHEFRQRVFLPMAAVSTGQTNGSPTTSDDSSSTDSSGSSSNNSSGSSDTSGSGSSFD
jgi:prepilin-type N-terminal cleavage/methylation domain-containing protein